MKKTLMTLLGILCSATMVAGFAACGGDEGGDNGDNAGSSTPTVTYTLDSTSFDDELTYKEAFSYGGLTLKGNDGSSVAVKAAMVSGATTSSVGDKTLTVSYEGKTIGTVNYSVKYEVEFIVDGSTVSTQYVMNASELTYPTDPTDDGFTGWSVAKGTAITDNTKIVAQFEDVEETSDIEIEFGESVVNGVYEMGYINPIGDISVIVTSTDANVTWSAEIDNDNISIEEAQDAIDIDASKMGVTTLTVTAEDGNGTVVEKSCKIVVVPQGFTINELALGSGKIESVRTLGRLDAQGNVSQTTLSLDLGEEDSIGEGLRENIKWSSNNSKVTVNNGVVTLGEGVGAEMVKLTAAFEVNGKAYVTSTAYEVRCVFDGVNVSTYDDLIATTESGKAVVLNGDIAFPTDVNKIEVYTMHTTYDDTYYAKKYKNDQSKYEEETQINVLVQFKNSLYGNGYEINAHNATLGLCELRETYIPTKDTIFRGPLNFVAMGSEGAGMLSVKAQDNVCFALFEGVTVNNVELRGCDLTANNGTVDLTDLNYAGTTVEVFGDNVTIEHSRITNGRTTVRIFGDAEDDEKAIHVTIDNCVISGAREFLLRIGSNRFVSKEDNASPYLKDDNGAALQAKKLNVGSQYYINMTQAQKNDYDSKYINTFVTVKDTEMKDTGIMAIGMDSHFAGVALHDPEQYRGVLGDSTDYWKNVAKTSYGAKLTFEGEVKMNTWKSLDQIDSSTLIENLQPEGGWTWSDLTFDVKTMIEEIADKPGFENLLATSGGKQYVHGGIAFFGGGRNYSVFEGNAGDYAGFEVDLDDVKQGMLKIAAGNENFYFIIHDKNSFQAQA